MVSQEIKSCSIALGSIMHQVGEEQAAVIRLVRNNLTAAADEAEEMEGGWDVRGVDLAFPAQCAR